MKACDLFVKCLEREGVEYIFGVPGEENLDLLDSLSHSSIRFVLTRHEQAAGFMAATYGRLTGRVGVCLSTLGPGATNLMTAAAFAQLGAMPLLMITGQKPIRSSEQGLFQRIDIVSMMHSVTKSAARMESADLIPARIRDAFRDALLDRPGAVHLELPEDIAQETTSRQPLPASTVRPAIAVAEAVNTAADYLRSAKRPLLLIGSAVNDSETAAALTRFVDHTGIRFVTTQMGKGVVAEDRSAYLGTAALSSGDFVHRAIDAADVILNVGHDVVEKPPFVMDHEDSGQTVIHVSSQTAQIDPVYCPQVEVIGDPADAITRITECFEGPLDYDDQFFEKAKIALQDHIRRDAEDDRFPILPQRLVAELRQMLGKEEIVALDNGIYKLWFSRNYPATCPQSLLLDNTLASMGAGLPSAMAASLICPDRRVVAVCGDGGFMMNSAELETATRLKLNLVVLILRDDVLGMIRWKQKDQNFDDFGLHFSNPDFVRYAQAYGAGGHSIKSIDDFRSTMEDALQSGGVHVVEVPVDYSENDRILNHEVQELSSQL